MSLADSPEPSRPQVTRLVLSDFRSYAALDLRTSARILALVGENGAGKTNLLEALSMFTPGRGLRRAALPEMARTGGAGGWAVSLELDADAGDAQLGVGFDPLDAAAGSRKYRVNRAPAGSARAFADYLRVVWLTPAMDALFTGAPSDRRRFLDRMVLAVDSDHGARVNAMERALRNRNRLLEDGVAEGRWLEAAEHELAGLAVAVAAARRETVIRLASHIGGDRTRSGFPWAHVEIAGDLETMLADLPALNVEDRYRALLRDNRGRDAAAGRTLIGPQASDLLVRHGPKDLEAGRASTGEQKALLVGLVLAHARLVASMSGIAPLLLLDEIAAHFDPARRAALFEELAMLGGQVWMTGADPAAFAHMPDAAVVLRVAGGRATAQ